MTACTDPGSTSSAIASRASGFWAYYRRYTTTAIHAAATATMTAFGLLLFIDPWFALLAIAAYVLPPVILYATGHDVGDPDAEPSVGTSRTEGRGDPVVASSGDREAASDVGRDADADGADADRDGVDRDSDGPDLDHDGPDMDRDGPDRDADGTDTDSDGADGDSDGPDLDRDG